MTKNCDGIVTKISISDGHLFDRLVMENCNEFVTKKKFINFSDGLETTL